MKSFDYRDAKVVGEKDVSSKEKILYNGTRWWLAEKKELPFAIMAHVNTIIKADIGRIDGYNQFAKLYGTWVPTFWNGYQISNSGRPTGQLRERLTYNIAQSCTDTLTAMMSANKPKPMFLTSGGSSSLQRRAKKLDKFCYGQFYANDYYRRAPKQFRDSCVFGEGILHPYVQNGVIKIERALPYEFLVDYLESHYGPESTNTIFRIRNVDRTALAQEYPECADQIAGMSATASLIATSNQSVSDNVTVVEAHRLKVGDKPGRHAVVSENVTLFDEEYEEDFFPYAWHRYNPRLYGFFSQGLVEQLVPSQVEINRTLISIQRSLYLGGTHKIFVKKGSKIIKSHFDNMIGTILEYAGDTPPQYVVPQLVQPEIYAHLNNMITLGYQLPGVSQMGATSMKTPGVNSGRAMRTEQNINTQRHQTIEQGYNEVALDVAKIMVSIARKEYRKGNNDIQSKVPGKRFIETIKWSEVDMDDDEYYLQMYPVSKLPQDPEGRIDTITELMQSGIISPEVGRRLLDYPDLEAEENLANASQDYLHKILDDIVDTGAYKEPEEDDNLGKAKELVMEYIAQGKLNNLAPSRLELLRLFSLQIDDLMPPAPQVQVPGQPMANPAATPVSDLVPNVNTAPVPASV